KESITITPAASNTDEFYNDVDYKKTMATSVIVPIDIQMWDEDHNVYNITSSTENWVLKADVTFNRNLSETNSNVETIDLVPYVGDAKLDTLLDSNQLVFVAVTFDHATYNIPETFSQYLYRITEDVENYVIYANDLISKTSGTNDEFKTLGLKAKNAYDSLYTEMSGYSSENLTRFENYIANSIQNIKKIDASNDKLKIYYENIANSIVGETTETLDYGNYTFNKTITFTMLSGDVITKDLTYSFEKADISEELKATAKTTGVSFKVGEVVTCSYAEDVNVAVNPIDILNVEFEDAEFVYDNTQKTIEATLTLLAGDNLNYTLSYNDQVSVENVGEYEVKLSSISGSDAKFYNIPETYSKGKLTINPVKYTINVNSTELIYNKQAQAYSFTLEQNTSNYVYSETDYKTTYTGVLKSGDVYAESEAKPTEAGNYTATVQILNSNLEFANTNENTFTFEIKQKQLESFSFDTVLEYNGAEQTFLFEFEDLIEGDELNILYDVYNTEGVKTSAKNADDYTLKITSVGNSNYCFETLSKSFVI
ncbi:MAG: hypothetical protein IJ415_00550, partial [Clostridia bacterium]|nr:hypothetical protein [Clostridia bacterium]